MNVTFAKFLDRCSDSYWTSSSENIKLLPPDLNSATCTDPDDVIFDHFKTGPGIGTVSAANFLVTLRTSGLKQSDPRLAKIIREIRILIQRELRFKAQKDPFNLNLTKDEFKSLITSNLSLVCRALRGQFVIPNWPAFCKHVEELYYQCLAIKDGSVAGLVEKLAPQNVDSWGVSVCTVDGQRYSWGPCNEQWCLQSISKPLTYGIALHEYGASTVHSLVGQEPSGRLFSEICLDHNEKPHNPFITAGAIVIASLIKKDQKLSDRFDFVVKKFAEMAGEEFIGFNNTVYQHQREKEVSDRSFALAYYLREHKCFPQDVNLQQILDLYFQLCSVEVTCESASVIAATLANGGVCPLNNKRVLGHRSVRDVLSLMYSCGMYDYSGQFAFRVGLPAKSGVSGGMILVIPNILGFALWSPPLDKSGNTVRGVEFSQKLVNVFSFHNCDNLLYGDGHKIDPRKKNVENPDNPLGNLFFDCKRGKLNEVMRHVYSGTDMNQTNYDWRTPLHVAASEGHEDIVKYLLERCDANIDAKDRWNCTALDNAKQFGLANCVKAIEDHVKNLAGDSGTGDGSEKMQKEKSSKQKTGSKYKGVINKDERKLR